MSTISTISSFSDIATFYANETASTAFEDAFAGQVDGVRFGDAAELATDLPDATQAQVAVEMVVDTIISLFEGTRLEARAASIAWGVVNSFHKTAEQVENEADAEARKLKRLLDEQDGSEIAALELEETQEKCRLLDEQREALACMRDYASDVYRVKVGRPWSALKGSTVSSKRTASVIAGHEFLAARAAARREQRNPTGPLVVFSGGQDWHDHEMLWARLDEVKARIPGMTLVTTAQTKGCDAIAAAWAASRGVKLVAMTLNRSLGNSAPFRRNEQLVALKPAEAIVCEGSGIQKNLWELLRKAGVPMHAYASAKQRPDTQRRA